MHKWYVKMVATGLISVMFLSGSAGCKSKEKKPLPPKLGKEPTISLYVNETGQVKRLKMEEYIQGVVAAEMDTSWPGNALAAQAILARTFTLKQMQDKGGVPRHKTDASTSVEEFQAYAPAKINDNVKQAVKMTRGEVVKYKDRYINAWFSACDGGTEASADEGLAYNKEKTPYIKAGVKDGCLSMTIPENKKWTASFPVSTVQSAILKATGKYPGDIGTASIAKRGPSGRAETLKIGKVTIGGPVLRLALGSDKMRSIYLDSVSIQEGKLVMSGRGFGHGVGMCQWGAKKIAAAGKKPEEIINFYFKDITVEKLWK